MPNNESEKPIAHVREIFARARNHPAGSARTRFLELACKNDPKRRKEVEALLDAYTASGTFLNRDAGGNVIRETGGLIGTQIGHYRILEHIGEGGFGEVYRAEQTEPIHREVALKIIKPGMDSREVIARFESERQALALMDHPNIAHVYDAGTTEDGRLYFVMELACGIPLTSYCDDHNLPLAARLMMYQQVCAAVQHAHQKGVIHRDLKPSNIVVTDQDGLPVPKIIDFGIAKSLLGRLTDHTLVTQRELFVGTPAYMSPEQLSLASDELDTRTDIYSLGVLLYELIAGVQPFESDTLRRAALAEVQRIIREVEPQKPSTRVHTLGDTAVEIARHRATEVLTLERTLRGDLDWIVMKAIEKERDRRYHGAGELGQDVARYLENRPVEAGPPSRNYRARKFVHRHRVGVAFTAAIAVAIILGLVLSLVGFSRARKERDRALVAELVAEVEAAKATTVRNLVMPMSEVRFSTDPSYLFYRHASDNTEANQRLKEALDALRTRIDEQLTTQPEIEAAARKTLADSYLSLGLSEEASEQLQRYTETIREIHGPRDIRYADSLVDYATALAQKFSSVDDTHIGYRMSWQGVRRFSHQYQLIMADRSMREALDIYRENNHLSVRYLSALRYSVSRLDIGLIEPLLIELAEATERLYGTESLPEDVFDRLKPDRFSMSGGLNSERMVWESMHPTFGAVRDRPELPITSGLMRFGQVHESVGQFEEAEAIYREAITHLEEGREDLQSEYEECVRSLVSLLGRMEKSDPEIDGILAETAFKRLFDPSLCIVEYRFVIQTPGTYHLHLLWEGHNRNSDRVCARIKELRDGAGGEVADVYGFFVAPLGLDADFSTVTVPQTAFFEATEPIGSDECHPTWEIPDSGTYTLQIVGVESGVALDTVVLHISKEDSQCGPIGEERTVRNPDGSFTEQDGRIVVEAENFSNRTRGQMTEWSIVPNEREPIADFRGFAGDGYLQVLPDSDPIDPVALLRSRAWIREELMRWQDAIEYYDEAIALDPTLYEFWLKRGLVYEKLQNFEKAAEDYRRAIDLAEDPDEARILRADCLSRLGRDREVITELGAVVPETTQNDKLVARLVRLLMGEGLSDEALDVVTEAIERQPYNASHWSTRGGVYADSGEFAKAKADFVKAIELDPNQLWRYGKAMLLYLMGGVLDRNEYEDVIRRMPIPSGPNPSISHVRFLFSMSFGPNLSPSREALISGADLILDTFSSDHEWIEPVRVQLAGAALFRAGEYDRAADLLLHAQEGTSVFWGERRSHYAFLLSMNCHQLGQTEEAKLWYNRAVKNLEEEDALIKERDPTYPNTWDAGLGIRLLRREAADMLGIAESS